MLVPALARGATGHADDRLLRRPNWQAELIARKPWDAPRWDRRSCAPRPLARAARSLGEQTQPGAAPRGATRADLLHSLASTGPVFAPGAARRGHCARRHLRDASPRRSRGSCAHGMRADRARQRARRRRVTRDLRARRAASWSSSSACRPRSRRSSRRAGRRPARDADAGAQLRERLAPRRRADRPVVSATPPAQEPPAPRSTRSAGLGPGRGPGSCCPATPARTRTRCARGPSRSVSPTACACWAGPATPTSKGSTRRDVSGLPFARGGIRAARPRGDAPRRARRLRGRRRRYPEVAGDAALLFDPESVDEIAAAVKRLLGEPEVCAKSSRPAAGGRPSGSRGAVLVGGHDAAYRGALGR